MHLEMIGLGRMGGNMVWRLIKNGHEWVVTGAEKVAMLKRLRDADASIPAGRIRQDHALVLADRAAAGEVALK